MNTHTREQTTPDSTDNNRPHSGMHAYGTVRSTPAWKRIDPDLSGGYVEIHLALVSDRSAISPEEVTSS